MSNEAKINELCALYREEAAKIANDFAALTTIVNAIEELNNAGEIPDPTPDPDPDQPFEGGYNKTYTLRGDWGGRDFWIAGFLWKPNSDNSNSLVVLLPGQIPGPDSSGSRVVKCWIASANLVKIVDLNYSGLGNPINGADRTHWRHSRDGASFPDGCYVVAEGSDGNRLLWKIEDTSVRNAGPINKTGQFAGNDKVQIKTVVLWTKGDSTPENPQQPDGTPDLSDLGDCLWIWREGSKANDFGHPNAVVVATHGLAGKATVRLISMNGDPVTDVASMVARTKQAKAEGCSAVCIDLESYFLRSGRANAESVFTACSKYLPVIWAPKAYNDHLIAQWGGTFADSAAWLDRFGNGQVAWIYSIPTYEGWSKLIGATRSAGNDDLYVALGDFEQRTSAGQLTRPFQSGEISKFAAVKAAVGVFMPDSNGWSTIVTRGSNWAESKVAYT